MASDDRTRSVSVNSGDPGEDVGALVQRVHELQEWVVRLSARLHTVEERLARVEAEASRHAAGREDGPSDELVSDLDPRDFLVRITEGILPGDRMHQPGRRR